jgi:hypothetical protein
MKKNMKDNSKIYFPRLSTMNLVAIPIIAGFICFLILLGTGGYHPGEHKHDLLISLGFFFLGLSGVPIIIRKEFPGIFAVYGLHAVISGILILISSWSLALLPYTPTLFKALGIS